MYDHREPEQWRDGFAAALEILSSKFEIIQHNVLYDLATLPEDVSFVLGRGDWDGQVDMHVRWVAKELKVPCGLAVCGNVREPIAPEAYDVVFWENLIQKDQLVKAGYPIDQMIHAFGVNTHINHNMPLVIKMFDYLTVGAFALWKRQSHMCLKDGVRLAVGEIQKENKEESMAIINQLLDHGVGVMDSVDSDTLAIMYNAAKCVYIPADIDGGGERAVLEAMACDTKVEIEPDNVKLQWFIDQNKNGVIWDQDYYAIQLLKGIKPYV